MPVRQKLYIKKRADLEKKLSSLRAKKRKLRADEEALQQQVDALEEVTPEIEQQVEDLEQQQTETDDAITEILDEIEELDAKIEELSGGAPADEDDEPAPSRSSRAARGGASAGAARAARGLESRNFNCRSRMFATRAQRDAFYQNANVAAFLGRIRTMLGNPSKGQRRSVTGAELTIPTEVLDILRDNANVYSKLAKYVRSRQVKGTARQPILGDIPEGVWMEMKGALNELTFTINEVEVDGFKVGGVIVLDNYLLHDSDIALGEEVLYQLGQAIGYARDKAIVFGKGKAYKMPLGFVTRLAQTSQPADWGENRRPWVDLHSTNILKLNLASESGATFFIPFLTALAKAKTRYTNGERVWVMNEATKINILIKSLGVDSAAAIVAGMNNTMPIIGGQIETLEFMPDNVVAGGCLGAFLEVEREGGSFGFSDLPLYIQDKTVFKGVARYDGLPTVDEDFVIVNYANQDVVTELPFAADYAGDGLNVLICTAAAGAAAGKTVVTVAGSVSNTPTLKYAVRFSGSISAGDELPEGFEALTSGTTAITAAAGAPITVVELDGDNRVISVGSVASVPKAS